MKKTVRPVLSLTDLRYALIQHGIELPVINVTHPSFAVDRSSSEGGLFGYATNIPSSISS